MAEKVPQNQEAFEKANPKKEVKKLSEIVNKKIDELIRRVEKMETIVELIRRQLKVSSKP